MAKPHTHDVLGALPIPQAESLQCVRSTAPSDIDCRDMRDNRLQSLGHWEGALRSQKLFPLSY